MKAIYTIILLLIANSSNAQRRGNENMNDLMRNKSKLAHSIAIQAGIGYSFLQAARFNKLTSAMSADYFNTKHATLPVFLIAGDVRLHKRWGGQISLSYTGKSYQSYKLAPLVVGVTGQRNYQYNYRTSINRVAFRGNFHALANQRFFECMISPELGFTFRKTKFKTENPNIDPVWDPTIPQPSLQLNAALRISARWWLYRSFGLIAEVGTGVDHHSKKITSNHEEIMIGICLRP
jgi:hypothetical protein